MNLAILIIQIVLAVFFLMPAYAKLITPKQKLIDTKKLAPDGSIIPVRLIGLAELLGAIGITVPYLTGMVPVLTPLAAVGFCIVMVGAFMVHYKKHEFKTLPLLIVIFALSGMVAWYRF